jgi:hypothetical protein
MDFILVITFVEQMKCILRNNIINPVTGLIKSIGKIDHGSLIRVQNGILEIYNYTKEGGLTLDEKYLQNFEGGNIPDKPVLFFVTPVNPGESFRRGRSFFSPRKKIDIMMTADEKSIVNLAAKQICTLLGLVSEREGGAAAPQGKILLTMKVGYPEYDQDGNPVQMERSVDVWAGKKDTLKNIRDNITRRSLGADIELPTEFWFNYPATGLEIDKDNERYFNAVFYESSDKPLAMLRDGDQGRWEALSDAYDNNVELLSQVIKAKQECNDSLVEAEENAEEYKTLMEEAQMEKGEDEVAKQEGTHRVQELEGQKAELLKEDRDWQAEIDELQKSISEIEQGHAKTIKELQQKLDDKNCVDEVDAIKDELEQTHSEKITEMQREIQSIQEAKDQEEAARQEAQDALKGVNEALEDEKAKKEEAIRNKNTVEEGAVAKVREAESKEGEARTALSEIQTTNDDLKRRLAVKNNELAAARAAAEAALVPEGADQPSLFDELGGEDEQDGECDKKIKALQQEHQENKATLQQQNRELQQQHQQHTEALQQEHQENKATLQQQNRELQQQHDSEKDAIQQGHLEHTAALQQQHQEAIEALELEHEELKLKQKHTPPVKQGLFLCGDYLYSHQDVMYQLILELLRCNLRLQGRLYILKGFDEREYGKNPTESCTKDIKNKKFSFTNYEKSKADKNLFGSLQDVLTVNTEKKALGPNDFFRFLTELLSAGQGGGKKRRKKTKKKTRAHQKKKSIRTKRKMKRSRRSRSGRSRRTKKRVKKKILN